MSSSVPATEGPEPYMLARATEVITASSRFQLAPGKTAGYCGEMTLVAELPIDGSHRGSNRPPLGSPAQVPCSPRLLLLSTQLQAVDGVALKQAADAWVNAPASEKAPGSPTRRQSAGSSGEPIATSASHWVSRSYWSALPQR